MLCPLSLASKVLEESTYYTSFMLCLLCLFYLLLTSSIVTFYIVHNHVLHKMVIDLVF